MITLSERPAQLSDDDDDDDDDDDNDDVDDYSDFISTHFLCDVLGAQGNALKSRPGREGPDWAGISAGIQNWRERGKSLGKALVPRPQSTGCAVSSTQKFLVQQHITTSKHQANKQLNSKQRQLFLTQPTTSNVRSEFNIDLCRSLISADIPLYKLKNKVFREFLEKYTQHTIPDESTLRKTYAPSIYDETIQKIRDEIKDSSIWVSIDETPDKEGRLVGNVVIGLLSEQYSERILLHCDVLEKCNNKTIVKLFNEAMGILWPKGIMYDNVLFFISDAAPYMVKAGQALSVVYPKLTHFTCVAHAFHRVAEVVRDNFLK
ncbi:hypothetical protein ANN_17173 [Periplaneta americana]|uniref:DUF659 domain-containing protein n=1 Tax=Periplaneta americana TaxID=6978 RepID=A0ABQ8SS67_PERAM|nr:hypothetical protein ANN_17173 [Periplaneta americana]